MNSTPTFQTLQLDCLLQILKHVSLPECMLLRTTCRHLKATVEEHFRSGVQTLPVLLSAQYSSEIIERYENFRTTMMQRNWFYETERICFGSGVSRLEIWERKRFSFINQKSYFRSKNYLILFDMAKLEAFMNFIVKYLPNVTKLALITDHDDYFRMIPTILNLYKKRLKVLLLDRSLRSVFEFQMEKNHKQSMKLSSECYDSIDNLEVLEEMYFFTKNCHIINERLKDNFGDEGNRFIDSMFCKLRVLHVNFDRDPEKEERIRTEVFNKLEELSCNSLENFNQPSVSYPQLKKCFFLGNFYHTPAENLEMPQSLEEIQFVETPLQTHSEIFLTLNKIPNLQRLRCECIYLRTDAEDNTWMSNKTIKFIEIDMLYQKWSAMSTEESLKLVKQCLKFFKALGKAVIREPYIELTGSDLL